MKCHKEMHRDSKAAAFILQVHKAKLKFSGTVVAVKVQYPDSLNVMLQVSLPGQTGPCCLSKGALCVCAC